MRFAKSIFKNTIALSIASVGQLLGNIVLFFYLSRLLQAEGLGIYSTVIAIFHTASLGCGIGFNTLLPRELPKDLSKTNKYFVHASIVAITSSILIIIILAILIPFMGYVPQTKIGIFIISLALLPESMHVILFATFISHQKAEFTTGTSLFVILGRIVLSLILLKLGLGVIAIIIVYAVFSYISVFVNLYFMKRNIQTIHWEFDKKFLIDMLRELKVFAGLAFLNALFSQSEVIILSLLKGETQVGYYSASLKLVTIWSMVPSSYMMATFPILSAAYKESKQKAFSIQNRSLKYLIALSLPLAVGISFSATEIIPVVYGEGFSISVSVLRIVSWYLPLIFCNMVLWRVLVVRGDQKIVFKVQFLTEVVQALLAVLLIPILGIDGAAWALLGGNFAYSVLHIYFIKRANIPLPIFDIGWRFGLASIVMGFFVWYFTPTLHLLFLVPSSTVLYLFFLWVFRAFSSEEISLLMHLLNMPGKIQRVL